MEVTITGDQRSGKTELLLAMAERLARQGQNVLYVSDLRINVRQAFLRLARDIQIDKSGSFRFFWSEGGERIEHDSGGVIRFGSARSRNFGRGLTVDTLLLDDGAEFCHPTARHVYRTELL